MLLKSALQRQDAQRAPDRADIESLDASRAVLLAKNRDRLGLETAATSVQNAIMSC